MAGLMILFLLINCSNSSKLGISHGAIDFAEIYKDNKEVMLFRFGIVSKPFLLYSTLDVVTIIAPDSTKEVKTPFVTFMPNIKYPTTVLIELGSQEEMHRWRNAIRQKEPRVLYPLFEFKEDEVAKQR